jgi:hypothetical protein
MLGTSTSGAIDGEVEEEEEERFSCDRLCMSSSKGLDVMNGQRDPCGGRCKADAVRVGVISEGEVHDCCGAT